MLLVTSDGGGKGKVKVSAVLAEERDREHEDAQKSVLREPLP
jgi:hypothetical protein